MDAWHPVVRPWILSAEVGGGGCRYENWNTTTKTDIKEVAQRWIWTPLGSVWCIKFGHRLHLSLSAQPDNV